MKSLLTILLLMIVIVSAQGEVTTLDFQKDQIVTLQDVDVVGDVVVASESFGVDVIKYQMVKQFDETVIETTHGLKSDGHIKPKHEPHPINQERLKSDYKTLKYVTPFRDTISWFYLYHRKL